MTTRPPGEHPHSDRPNFTFEDYLQMVRDGEAKLSIAECARLLGWSRAKVYRAILMASVTDAEFDEVLSDLTAAGKLISTVAIADEIKRRTGQARRYVERCPHCGGALRTRHR